ncbi:MAG: PhnD/SsuA/transferrin family substrate-binding protein [Thermodesulfovibrionales bacterium]|nr:PhnD/SsuA/transferrin family substrate-binding protein [Thermodesulfovibrionales bacterium]
MKNDFYSLKIIIFTCLNLLFIDSTAFASQKDTYYLSIVPFHAPEKILTLYQPMVDYLNKHSKYKWELKLFQSHEAIAKGLCSSETSIAMLSSPMAYVSHQICQVQPVVMVLGLEKKPTFKIVLITARKDITTVKDLKGKTFGIFKPNTIARALSRKMILDEGLQLSDIKFITYSRLEDIVKDVMSGEIDAGGIRESVYLNFKETDIRVFRSSEEYTGFAFFVKNDFNKNVIKDFQRVMTKLNVNKNPETLKITNKWDLEVSNGFVLPNKGYMEDLVKNHELIKDLYK